MIQQSIRCSILFRLLVPGGKWHTHTARPVSSAERCSSRFHSRPVGLFEPPDPLSPAPLRTHGGSDEVRRCVGYVEANRAQMRYPAFRAAGLPVGSGVVESTCSTAAGRLKRGGMRWSVDGVNAILALHCRWLDDRYDRFFQSRSRPPPMVLVA